MEAGSMKVSPKLLAVVVIVAVLVAAFVMVNNAVLSWR